MSVHEKTKGREMLFHDVIFAAVIFTLCSSGNGLTRNWVKQWPGEVYGTPGENITIHCQIHADVQENVSRCLVQWNTMDRDGTYPKINQLFQFSGRNKIKNESRWSSSLTLNSLKMNDTGRFYCTYFCKMNGTFRHHYGSGTKLFVHFGIDRENVTLHYPLFPTTVTDGVKGQSRLYMLYLILVLVLSSKLVVFIFVTSVALFS